MFNLENTESNTTRSAGLIIEELQFDSGIAPFDLMLEISKKRDSLCCHFAYDTDLFDVATVRRLCGSYLTLLEGIVADHRRRISQISVITADERHRLLVEWNETELEYPATIRSTSCSKCRWHGPRIVSQWCAGEKRTDLPRTESTG